MSEMDRTVDDDSSSFILEPSIANHDDRGNLTSPLLLQQEEYNDDDNYNDHHNDDEYNNNEEENEVDQKENITLISNIKSKEYYEILLMSMCTMTFMILVLGSYFFEWSDTVLNVQMDTLIVGENGSENRNWNATANSSSSSSDHPNSGEEKRLERGETISVDLPLYTDATFQSTLGIFQSSQSNMIVFLIITSSIITPILFTILQPLLILLISSYKTSFSSSSSSSEEEEIEYAQTLSYKFKYYTYMIWNQARIGFMIQLLRFIMKFSMALIFVNSILNVCTSNVEFVLGGDFGPTSTTTSSAGSSSNSSSDGSIRFLDDQIIGNDGNTINVQVVNRARGGLISYMIGFSIFGIVALILIQIYWERKVGKVKGESNIGRHDYDSHNNDYHGDYDNDNDDAAVASELNSHDGGASILSPPPSAAFRRHEQFFVDSDQYVLSNDDDESYVCDTSVGSRNFVDNGGLETTNNLDDQSEHMTPLLISGQHKDDEDDNGEQETNRTSNGRKFRPSVKELILFESGLLSFLLLVPISTLPLIEIEYTGFLRPLLATHTLENTSFTLWGIANAIVSSNNFGRDLFGFTSIVLFWVNVIVIPLLLWVCCTTIWFIIFILKRGNLRIIPKILQVMKMTHPFSFMTPFAMSVFVTVLSLQQVTDFLFNQNGFCSIVQNSFGLNGSNGKCMLIEGRILSGCYVLFLQSVFLDIFITMIFKFVQ